MTDAHPSVPILPLLCSHIHGKKPGTGTGKGEREDCAKCNKERRKKVWPEHVVLINSYILLAVFDVTNVFYSKNAHLFLVLSNIGCPTLQRSHGTDYLLFAFVYTLKR